MSEPAVTASNPIYDRHAWRARFMTRVNRFKNLLTTKWWILASGLLLGLVVQAALWRFGPPSYSSLGRMIVNIKLAIPEGSFYTEELNNFLGTQQALMQSGVVINRAHLRVAAQKASRGMRPVALKVSVLPRTTIFSLQATGEDPDYTEAFLQAVMEEYVTLKKEMRAQTSDTTVAGLTEEVLRLEKDLRKSDAELTAFQSSNSVVLLQEQGNSAGTYLAALNQQMAMLKSEYDLLQMLTLDQNLERRQPTRDAVSVGNDPAGRSGNGGAEPTDNEYFKAKQQILLLKAEQQDLGQYLKPKHPKMIAMSEEISRCERLLDIFRQQSAEQLESRKSSLGLQIENLKKDIADWNVKTLEISGKMAEYQRLKADSQRIQALYDRLLATMETLDVNKEISPESVTIMEKASPGAPDKAGLARKLMIGGLTGLGLSLVALLIINRLDDRLNSFGELQDLFDETVLGQIPMEKSLRLPDNTGLIQADDGRHRFVEAYRNIRSSLLYMAESSARPRTLLITSSVPGEGKSITSANLAITIANAGAKVLLVDGDLRKGVLHSRFNFSAAPGLSEVLSKGFDFKEALHPTSVPNLSLLSRGSATFNSSELFINPATAKFLKEAAALYDYILLDTAPVMAADDVTSLAPHVDGTIFVIRAEFTSARVARAALDLLYQRQVKVIGLALNAVRPSTIDYYYYKYHDYAYYPTAGSAEAREKAPVPKS